MTAPKYLLLGDTHGQLDPVIEAVAMTLDNGVKTLVQLGDWGFCWPSGGKVNALRSLLEANRVTMYFLDGNHDWHPEINRRWFDGQFQDHDVLRFMRRGTSPFPGVVALGGAASIDKRHRRPGHSWWPDELITIDQVASPTLAAREHTTTPCDVLLTHDAPVLPPGLPPFPGASKADYAYCEGNREMIRAAMRCKPRRCFHGHYHMRYESRYEDTIVIGLAADGTKGSMLLVDEHWDPVKP